MICKAKLRIFWTGKVKLLNIILNFFDLGGYEFRGVLVDYKEFVRLLC